MPRPTIFKSFGDSPDLVAPRTGGHFQCRRENPGRSTVPKVPPVDLQTAPKRVLPHAFGYCLHQRVIAAHAHHGIDRLEDAGQIRHERVKPDLARAGRSFSHESSHSAGKMPAARQTDTPSGGSAKAGIPNTRFMLLRNIVAL